MLNVEKVLAELFHLLATKGKRREEENLVNC